MSNFEIVMHTLAMKYDCSILPQALESLSRVKSSSRLRTMAKLQTTMGNTSRGTSSKWGLDLVVELFWAPCFGNMQGPKLGGYPHGLFRTSGSGSKYEDLQTYIHLYTQEPAKKSKTLYSPLYLKWLKEWNLVPTSIQVRVQTLTHPPDIFSIEV